MGSYHQLAGYVTDADPAALGDAGDGAGGRGAPQVAGECDGCEACAGACPTGAIDPGRFLLHAERCVTLANEREDAWPGWVPPEAHNCLVGCMICQEACPMNAGLLRVETVETAFSGEETAAILAGRHVEGIASRFASLGLQGFERDAGRNLRALLEARAKAETAEGLISPILS
ncbi:MAG: 4Fe-4S double cluster binding domain-containing protein [Ignavibacteriales bacterium]